MSGLTFLALFAVFQNLDNLVLAAAYRWQGIQIRWGSSCFIGALSGVFTAAALLTAHFAKSQAFWLGVGRYAEVLGRGVLVTIGVLTLVGYFHARLCPLLYSSCPAKAPPRSATKLAEMKFNETVLVGTALAIDNLGPSFAFGLVESATTSVGLTLSAMTGVVSVLAVLAGQAAGAKGRHQLRQFPPKLVAASLIFCVALFDPGDLVHESFKAAN
jgi:putative Mn2+ efflux pump MntP